MAYRHEDLPRGHESGDGGGSQERLGGLPGNTDDREDDPAETGIGDADGLQEQTMGEPSLTNQDHAWTQRTGNARGWWSQGDDRELDRADYEPSLGGSKPS